MKIIGESTESFIIEASKNEVANLLGYYSKYSDRKPPVVVGNEIKINEMYTQLYELSRRKDDLKKMHDSLIEYASYLLEIDPIKVRVQE
jgi:hypothetical protein